MRQQGRSVRPGASIGPREASGICPGRRTLVEQAYGSEPVQRRAAVKERGSKVQAREDIAMDPAEVHRIAASGLEGAGQPLPHLGAIQHAFGHHDLSGVTAHVGGPAASAAQAMGAQAYATGNQVAFQSSPDLHTTAHEAAHVIQQRGGVQLASGVGKSGDENERQADEVADRVVRGESAAELLGSGTGTSSSAVQRQEGPQATEGHEASYWIDTHRSNANLRDSPGGQVLLTFVSVGSPLYYLGRWKNGPVYQGEGASEARFPERWLEVEFPHPDWSAPVHGWMHSAVTNYPGDDDVPSEETLRQVQVTIVALPPEVDTAGPQDGGTGDGGVTTIGETGGAVLGEGEQPLLEPYVLENIRDGALVSVGAGLDVPYVSDSATPLAMLAELPRIRPFLVEGQGNGVVFYNSPNINNRGLESRVNVVTAVVGIVRGRPYDYVTFEYAEGIDGGTVRRSDIWLICEYEGGTYFVHAGSTTVIDRHLTAALSGGAPDAETSSSEDGQSGDSSAALPGASGQTTTIESLEGAKIRSNAAAGPDDANLGELPRGANVIVLLQYETQDRAGVVRTDHGDSSMWMYIEVPEGQVVTDDAGNPLENPPRRGWIHASLTALGGSGEPLSSRPGNEGADQLEMPGDPSLPIEEPLTPGTISREVQMAKVQLVRLRFLTTSEYRVVSPNYYSGRTRDAVRSFQFVVMQRDDDQADGIISPAVWEALFDEKTRPQNHMTLDAVEGVLAGAQLTDEYQWDAPANPYAFENLGSSDYWGPRIPGGECTWFVRAVLIDLPVTSPAASWSTDLEYYKQASPARGDVMNQGTHVAIVTAVHEDPPAIDLIECNWTYSRAVGVRNNVPVAPDMAFLRYPR